ncbi:hypothetical protein AMS68_005551 [Peltaster fructicola]|uniref:Cyclin n=1 Tax=Peltaster fructicola TaxID=286661 RepID=A0A6H0XZ56_9PEZI|nr:hypothetical protein AMS68_005551 [Peltaster fructicola]
MSQRASSGGSSSTSATASSPPRNRSSVISAPRSDTTPSEPTLRTTNSPFTPQTERGNAIENAVMDTPTRAARPRRIKVRDLEHIQSFATEDMNAFSELRNRSRSRSRGAHDEGTQYEISEMKVEHIIEMVAGLLTKITSTNDQQHEHLHRQPPSIDHASSLSAQTSSVLAFHGKNIPSITILSYLSRINKYCPTSYEVFLSLLVYFDRMTERVNAGPIQGLRQANEQAHSRHRDSGSSSSSSSLSSDKMEDIINNGGEQAAQTATPPASGSMEKATEQNIPGTPHSKPQGVDSPSIPAEPRSADLYNLSHFFVVDSFNIHRLVIAGVTCASKFFSDIFYTNSRYAKVGGLPLPELNHLELQFLLLNDFRLSIPVEEIEAYGTMLVEFYAREVVAQQRAADAMQLRSSSESSADSASTVQAAG